MEEDDTLELSIDPFLLEERLQAAQKRSPKPLPEERLQAAQKRSPKPLPEERLPAAQKRSPKPLPEEKLQAAQNRSPKPLPLKHAPLQVGEEEDVQASKPLPEGRKKSPALQEQSKQSSQRRRLIMEEDDEMFPCNIDPFQFEAQDENEAAESDQSLQENSF